MDTKTTMELVAEAKGQIENLAPDAVARERRTARWYWSTCASPRSWPSRGIIPNHAHLDGGVKAWKEAGEPTQPQP